jgi:DivIVA domain-containing protein
MIDLTQLDVRNKRGEFKRLMRGYDPQEVDVFLEFVAERLETLVRENLQLRERSQGLQDQVDHQASREQAVHDALVTAQELRAEIRTQTQREAEQLIREAEAEARRILTEADAEARTVTRQGERNVEVLKDATGELDRRRARFLREFRSLLERELEVVGVEENRAPLEERAIELKLGGMRRGDAAPVVDEAVLDHAAEPAEVGSEPSSLEVELVAGVGGEGAAPDLETVLAEAGAEPVTSDVSDAPPAPIEGRPEDGQILMEKDAKGSKR